MLRFLRMGNKRTKTIWWVLIVVTVVTFLGGFVFLLGAGLDSGQRARMSGAVGSVDGSSISRTDYQTSLAEARAQYQRQYGGAQPTEQDQRVIEVQAWRSLVLQRLMGAQARAAGIGSTDREVLLAMQTNPPAMLVNSPSFQTDGKFDPSKYQQALANPNNHWGEIENLVRSQLPVRKLQERLIGALKVTQPELRQAYLERNERVNATILQLPASTAPNMPAPTDTDLQRVFEEYKSRFASGPRTQLEVLAAPRKFGDEEVRAAMELATSLANRARGGEDFAQLAKDYSEGPGAENGGELPNVVTPQDFGPELGPKVLSVPAGGISEPFRDGSRFLIFKVLERIPGPNNSVLGIRLAQIITKIRQGDATLREQAEELNKLRARAQRIGLGKAAAEKGLATRKSEAYDYNNPPQSLFAIPEAGEWGLSAKVNAVSPVFAGPDEFIICQVAQQRPAGVPSRTELAEPLRNIAELYARVEATKSRADSAQKALQSGMPLEDVARQLGLSPFRVEGTTRAQPDPRLGASEELVGALFGAPLGKTIGPYRALNGWYFARVESRSLPDTAMFDSTRTQLSSEILGQRQRNFMNGYMAQLRTGAKIQDLRNEQGQ